MVSGSKNRRRSVKRLFIPLTPSRKLEITFRPFYTSASRRSKRYRQLVIPIELGVYRETAFRFITRQRPAKRRASQPLSFKSLIAQPRSALSLLLILLGLSGAVYFGLQLRPDRPIAINEVPTPAVSRPVAANLSNTLSRSEPQRIRIPSLKIDTSVMTVGRKSDDTMQVPKSFDVTGWYKFGPTPGELGPAIVVGHVDSYKGPAVFWRLWALQKGDVVEIDRADGTTARFKVDIVKQFEQNNFPTKEVYGNIDHAGLRLITCGGIYDRQALKYSHNIVAYGHLI